MSHFPSRYRKGSNEIDSVWDLMTHEWSVVDWVKSQTSDRDQSDRHFANDMDGLPAMQHQSMG